MRVDLILTDRKSYTFENYAVKRIANVLEEKRISYKIIYLSDGCFQDYLAYIRHSPPNWTLGFSSQKSRDIPLCGSLKVPHFCWVEDSLAFAIPHLLFSCGYVGIPNNLSFGLPKNAFYLPHGVDVPHLTQNKHFDTVLFGDFMELSFIEKGWAELFSAKEIENLKKAVLQKNPLSAGELYYYAEMAINSKKTEEIIRCFASHQLDVFGEHVGTHLLTSLANGISLHSKLAFCDYFEVLKAAKTAIILPETAWYLPAIAADCLPIATAGEAVFYIAHPEERLHKLEVLKTLLPNFTWKAQTEKVIGTMNAAQCHHANG